MRVMIGGGTTTCCYYVYRYPADQRMHGYYSYVWQHGVMTTLVITYARLGRVSAINSARAAALWHA
jgi:hypothetical protein